MVKAVREAEAEHSAVAEAGRAKRITDATGEEAAGVVGGIEAIGQVQGILSVLAIDFDAVGQGVKTGSEVSGW